MEKEVKWCFAGEKVDEWLKKNNTSREEFARRLGVSKMSLWRWMAGRAYPPLKDAFNIQEITDISVKYWLA